jgi:rubrerythrin
MKIFESQDILLFAKRIEENGERFYQQSADRLQDPKAKELFRYLAEEERVHRNVFEGMLSTMERSDVRETYEGEYLSYLQNYLDRKVIFDSKAAERELADVQDPMSAIDFAIRREMDAILYFTEVKHFVTEGQQGPIDRILEEERGHFSQLSNLKKTFEKKH